jgi:osmotically-inducible protein OsmY
MVIEKIAVPKSAALLMLVATVAMLLGVACTTTKTDATIYKDNVKAALEQAELKDVTVSEDRDKNTITLGGTVHSEEAKNRAATVAQASAGPRIVANEVGVEPVGNEGASRNREQLQSRPHFEGPRQTAHSL